MGEERADNFAEDDLAEFKPAPAKRPSPAVAKQAAAASRALSAGGRAHCTAHNAAGEGPATAAPHRP